MADEQSKWVCPLCDIECTTDKCQKCGCEHSMIAMLMESFEEEIVDPETSWTCAYCGFDKNAAERESCKTCGISKQATDKVIAQQVLQETQQISKDIQIIAKVKKIIHNPVFIIFVVFVSLVFGINVLYNLTFIKGNIFAQGWVRTVQIEKYTEVIESGYIVPKDAVILSSEQVFTHYKVTPVVTENTAQGVTTVITTEKYKPFTKSDKQTYLIDTKITVPYVETTKGTVDYTEKEPVYRTKYTYKYMTWVPAQKIVASGDNKIVYECQYTLAGNERISDTQECYFIDVQFDGCKKHIYMDYDVWTQFTVGDTYKTYRSKL